MASKQDYFGLGRLISLILAIIPVTSFVCGVVTRFMEGRWIAALLRLFLGWNIIYILDLIFMVINGRTFQLI